MEYNNQYGVGSVNSAYANEKSGGTSAPPGFVTDQHQQNPSISSNQATPSYRLYPTQNETRYPLPGDSQFSGGAPPPPYWQQQQSDPNSGIHMTQPTGTGPNAYPYINEPRWQPPTPQISEHDKMVEKNILAFSKKSVRLAFTRKVYAIIVVQLLMTAGIISIFTFHKEIKEWVPDNLGFVVAVGAVVLVLTVITYCADSLRRRAPQNLILLAILTIAYGILAGAICAYFQTEAVLYGAGITVAVCLTLALFSLQSKFDFNMCSGFFVSFIVLAIICTTLILLQTNDVIEMEIFHLVLACAGALLLALLLIFDVTRIMGGSHSYAISPEEYVLGAIAIYTDIVIIFILIVVIIGASQGGGNNCKCSGGGAGGGGYYGGYHGGHCCIWCCPVHTSSERRDDAQTQGDEQL